jgi:hypothetical protein
MVKRVWVDSRRARVGALVALAGLVLLVATQVLRAELGDPGCISIANSERARECVAESAQTLDRENLVLFGAVAVALSVIVAGGTLVLRGRRRALDLDEAAELLDTDRKGIRASISIGELTSYGSQGRTYVDATDVERLRHDVAAKRGALPEGV